MSDEIWRVLVNSFDALPEDGKLAPQLESIEPFAPEEPEQAPPAVGEVFVQKVVTEMYIFTNSKDQTFGEYTFQDMVVLGNMTVERLTKLLNRQKRKREKGS